MWKSGIVRTHVTSHGRTNERESRGFRTRRNMESLKTTVNWALIAYCRPNSFTCRGLGQFIIEEV